MATHEPQWTPEEEALHVAYELSPELRLQFPTFTAAMNNPATAAALRAFAHAWQTTHPKEEREPS